MTEVGPILVGPFANAFSFGFILFPFVFLNAPDLRKNSVTSERLPALAGFPH